MDASALVHLCVPGSGSHLAATLWNRADLVATSRLADVEISAVLRAGQRSGALDHETHARAVTAWREVRAGLHVVEVTPDVAAVAESLASSDPVPLRADDAIHVASALAVAHAETLVAAWDDAVAAAARREGLTVVP